MGNPDQFHLHVEKVDADKVALMQQAADLAGRTAVHVVAEPGETFINKGHVHVVGEGQRAVSVSGMNVEDYHEHRRALESQAEQAAQDQSVAH